MKHLTYTDRLCIEKMCVKGISKRVIADTLGVSLPTIYRELQRGAVSLLNGSTWQRYDSYSADVAQQDYNYKASGKGAPLKLGSNKMLANVIEYLILKKRYSPYAAIALLNNIGLSVPFCRVTLYSYIDKGVFAQLTNKDLHEKCRRKRKYRRIKKASRAPAGCSIDRRPDEIAKRTGYGHWEMDCVIGRSQGKGQAILTLTERLTRYEIIMKLKAKDSKSVVAALDKLQKRYTFQSITVDNGSEFADAYGMEHDKNGNKRTTVYYCHPYTSCERGSNERHNRMIRRYIPKGCDMRQYNQKFLDAVANRLNTCPRHILNGQTPEQLFSYYSNLPATG